MARLYVVPRYYAWESIQASSGAKVSWEGLSCGFFPVYASREDAAAEHPEDPVWEIDLVFELERGDGHAG